MDKTASNVVAIEGESKEDLSSLPDKETAFGGVSSETDTTPVTTEFTSGTLIPTENSFCFGSIQPTASSNSRALTGAVFGSRESISHLNSGEVGRGVFGEGSSQFGFNPHVYKPIMTATGFKSGGKEIVFTTFNGFNRPTEVVPRDTLSQCVTDTIIRKEKFAWSITNFKYRSEKRGQSIRSSEFVSGSGSEHERRWRLDIYPSGILNTRFVPLKIVLLNNDEKNSESQVHLKVSVANFIKSAFSQAEHVFESETIPETGVVYHPEFLDKSDIGKLGPEGTLVILFEVGTMIESSTTCRATNRFPLPEDSLRKSLGEYFINGKYSDVTLEVDGGEFKLHKVILAAHSSVFATMFSDYKTALNRDSADEAEESNTTPEETEHVNNFKIKSLQFLVAKIMFEYIYTGEKPSESILKEWGIKLLSAANKYRLEGLKMICQEFLHDQLSAENAVDTLIIAHKHNNQELKESAVQFIKHHGSIIKSHKFRELERNYPVLALNVFREIAFDKISDD